MVKVKITLFLNQMVIKHPLVKVKHLEAVITLVLA